MKKINKLINIVVEYIKKYELDEIEYRTETEELIEYNYSIELFNNYKDVILDNLQKEIDDDIFIKEGNKIYFNYEDFVELDKNNKIIDNKISNSTKNLLLHYFLNDYLSLINDNL